jgi:putative endonuclease
MIDLRKKNNRIREQVVSPYTSWKPRELTKKELGQFGENVAAEYLEKQGYVVEERNYKSRAGEIDLIGKTKDKIVFFEVKTRTSDICGSAAEAVDERKQKKIRSAAASYMMYRKVTNYDVAFDVIEVNISHIENAF